MVCIDMGIRQQHAYSQSAHGHTRGFTVYAVGRHLLQLLRGFNCLLFFRLRFVVNNKVARLALGAQRV